MANDLLKGLSILYDMELNNYMMLQAIDKLDYEISWRGRPNKTIRSPKKESACFDFESFFDWVKGLAGLGLIIWPIVGFINGEGFGGRLWSAFKNCFIGPIYGALIGVAIGLLLCLPGYLKEKSELKTKNEKENREYQNKLYNDNVRVQRQLVEIEILKNQRDLLVKKQRDSLSKLIFFYDKMGIDNNYRNLIPIGYMYDLCRLGVSNKLYGTDGLYYLVRKELRYDKLQYSLDEISSKLDTIISNQSSLYYEINDINNKCNNLLAQTKRSAELAAKNNQLVSNAVKNTSIANYNLQRIQAEAEYQNTMKWITNRW